MPSPPTPPLPPVPALSASASPASVSALAPPSCTHWTRTVTWTVACCPPHVAVTVTTPATRPVGTRTPVEALIDPTWRRSIQNEAATGCPWIEAEAVTVGAACPYLTLIALCVTATASGPSASTASMIAE